MTINFPQPASLNPGGGGVDCYPLSVLHLLPPLCDPQDEISSCTPKLELGLSSPCPRKNVNDYKGKEHRMRVIGPKQVSVRMGLQAAKLSPVRWSRVAPAGTKHQDLPTRGPCCLPCHSRDSPSF